MRILITGSSSGLGEKICEMFMDKEHQVEGIDLRAPENSAIAYHHLDLSNVDEVEDFVREADLDFDALIYCAGIHETCNPIELSTETWMNIFNVNLTSLFVLSKALIVNAILNDKKFSIVNIAGVAGIQAEIDRAAYVSSKYALIGLSKQLALQFGAHGIRVNVVSPGVIETPHTQDFFKDPNIVERIKESTPVGYWGQVGNIFPLIEMCLSNDYLNGSVLVCDGGWTVGKAL